MVTASPFTRLARSYWDSKVKHSHADISNECVPVMLMCECLSPIHIRLSLELSCIMKAVLVVIKLYVCVHLLIFRLQHTRGAEV